MRILIGNIVALIASCIMVYAGTLKEKKKIIIAQIVEIGFFIVSQLILRRYFWSHYECYEYYWQCNLLF